MNSLGIIVKILTYKINLKQRNVYIFYFLQMNNLTSEKKVLYRVIVRLSIIQ